MICSAPFKHEVFDKFTDPEVLDKIVSDWPVEHWKTHYHANSQNKRSIARLNQMPDSARDLILDLNKKWALDKFSEMLGYELLPDPFITSENRLWGGGLHEISKGGFLNVHVDFNKHPMGVWRRANLLIYLNRDWTWGGDLELWDDVKQVQIAPVFNRAVIFETSENSWHGHPIPLDCPEDQVRKSIAIYYYSVKGENVETHSTVYRG